METEHSEIKGQRCKRRVQGDRYQNRDKSCVFTVVSVQIKIIIKKLKLEERAPLFGASTSGLQASRTVDELHQAREDMDRRIRVSRTCFHGSPRGSFSDYWYITVACSRCEKKVRHCGEYSAFNFSFHKLCLILKDWFLIRFPPNFQERFLMSTASPKFVYWGPKIKQF